MRPASWTGFQANDTEAVPAPAPWESVIIGPSPDPPPEPHPVTVDSAIIMKPRLNVLNIVRVLLTLFLAG